MINRIIPNNIMFNKSQLYTKYYDVIRLKKYYQRVSCFTISILHQILWCYTIYRTPPNCIMFYKINFTPNIMMLYDLQNATKLYHVLQNQFYTKYYDVIQFKEYHQIVSCFKKSILHQILWCYTINRIPLNSIMFHKINVTQNIMMLYDLQNTTKLYHVLQ